MLDPSVLRDPRTAALLARAARLRAAADDLGQLAPALRGRAADAGLVGPAGDALQQLAAEVASEVHAVADAVRAAAARLPVGAG